MKLSCLSFVFSSSILLFSCSTNPLHTNLKSTTIYKKTISIDTLAFLQKDFYIQDNTCKDENCSFTSLNYTFYLKEPDLNDTLKAEIRDFLNVDDSVAFSKSIDTLFNEVTVDSGPDDSIPDYRPTTMSLSIERIHETSNIITLQLTHDVSGGAHPNEEIHYINWDKKHDKNISLEDIISDWDKLNKIAEKIFRHDAGLTSTDSLTAYHFEDGIFALNDNFAITDTSLSFFYNTYEIQGYMQGITIIDIPFKTIRKLINKDCVISQYIK